MTVDNFNRTMVYFGYRPDDRKHLCLRLVLVEGLSQAEASRATGYSQPQLSSVTRRVYRELDRIKTLTGVDLCA